MAKSRRAAGKVVDERVKLSTPSTEGQKQLLAVPGSLAVLAAALGVDRSSVGLWRTGRRQPSEVQRVRIRDVYGIEPAAWARKPGAALKAKDPPATPATPETPQTLLDTARAHVRELDQDARGEGLLPSDRLRIRTSKTMAMRLVADLEEREATREERIAESPALKRMTKVLLDALKPWPEAVQAAATAIGLERGTR